MLRNLFVFAMLLDPALGNAEPLQVFVSVLPQKTFVEKVSGDHAQVEVMVQPGHSPATYEPTPRQISALTKTALYFRIGVPFEAAWMDRIRSANPDMHVLDVRTGIDLLPIKHHSHGHAINKTEYIPDDTHDALHHSGSEHDPHVWTRPPLVKHMARNIRDALTMLDPANAQDYARNYHAYAAELSTLDSDIRALLKDVRNSKFMVFHPSWGYFADTYGLTQVPIEVAGKEPGARSLTRLIEQAKREQVKVIFVQPQFDKKSANQLARTIGGRVVAIDPLASNYADNLREAAQLIAETVRD